MTLTAALALLGAAVLLALLLHGWWRTRRAAPRRAAGTVGETGDGAAMQAERVEPALELESDTVPEMPPTLGALLRREVRLDALIDAIVPLPLEAPVMGEAALAHLPGSHRVGSKSFHVEGLEVGSARWEPLAPGRRYAELQAGVQMANRHGALNEIEYSEFVQQIEAFAEAVGARADIPDMLEVVARARELDALAAPLDALLTIRLRSSGVAWSVAYLQQVAARQGFVPSAVSGRLVLPAAEDGAPPVLVLTMDPQAALADSPQAAAVRECTLSLDVPQTPESAEPFPAFHRAATALAEDLDATAVDDQGEPITLHAYRAIGLEVQRLYRELEALDLAAGSATARRLFS